MWSAPEHQESHGVGGRAWAQDWEDVGRLAWPVSEHRKSVEVGKRPRSTGDGELGVRPVR